MERLSLQDELLDSKRQRSEPPLSSLGLAASEFELLFKDLPGILLVLKPDPPFFTMVAATGARFKVTMTDASTLGRGLFEMFPDNPDDPNATGAKNLLASLMRVLETKAPDAMAVQKYDIPRPESEGGGFEERYWSPLNSPVLDANGDVQYIIHKVEDVTEFIKLKQQGQELKTHAEQMESEIYARAQEIQKANEQLRVANDKLGQLDQLKTEFFSNISHEFRTPLTLMLGPLEDLIESNPAGSREVIEMVHRNALRLLRLVNSLLDFSRIEAGRIHAQFVPVDLAKFTAEIASAFDSAMVRAKVEYHIDCPPLESPVYVDKEMWEKIVLNLISNALKHTFEGHITVRLRQQEQAVELTVEDTGTGIPAKELPFIFDRFYRVENAQSRSKESTGIGLSLVRELCHLHSGEIDVKSASEQGAVFTVHIPLGQKHLPENQVQTLNEEVAAVHGDEFIQETDRWLGELDAPNTMTSVLRHEAKEAQPDTAARILLVDDNQDMRGYISRLLSDSGQNWVVETAVNGLEGLTQARTNRPDIILSDIMMPKMTGFELVNALRADPHFVDVPIILLSARAGDEAKVEGLDYGADDYLVKPFSARELVSRVKTHLSLSKARKELHTVLHEKNQQLDFANKELEAFSYSVAHDLRAPLRVIDGFREMLVDECAESIGEEGQEYLSRINVGVKRMNQLIEDLLELSRISRSQLLREQVDLSALAWTITQELQTRDPNRQVQFKIAEKMHCSCDRRLLTIVLENLLGNAWKYSQRQPNPIIEFGFEKANGYYIRDNGAGFDMSQSEKLFQPFQRLHTSQEFEGTGVGLAIVQRIIVRHGGEITAESQSGEGATFRFTLGDCTR